MRAILARLDIQKDPEIIRYRTENTKWSRARLARVLETGRGTFVLDQLQTFCGRAEAMSDTLGTLAADFYIAKVVNMVLASARGVHPASVVDQTIFHTWDYSSKIYLAGLLKGVQVDWDALTKAPATGSVSTKADRLVRILLRSHHNRSDRDRGIVFVTERATAVVLHHLLSQHATISKLFRVGCVLGSSRHDRGRRDLGDVHNPADQSGTIKKFRRGEVNLMVATSVAEEGLDVSACNLVVCFDPPMSAKSFIQHRGQARQAGSEYVILVDQTAQKEEKDWERMEAELRAKDLLPSSMDLPSLEVGRMQLYDLASSSDIPLAAADLAMVETLAGYSFRKRGLLVEALTHGSDLSAQEHDCYNRLAFLGNAIIENLVSDAIYRECSAQRDDDKSGGGGGCRLLGAMSSYRAAVVNRHYLGYLAMARHVSQARRRVKELRAGTDLVLEQYSAEFPLWRFLKHCSGEVAAEMSAAETRFATLRGDLAQAVESADAYPWLLLAQLRATDFYADVVESLVGAVFVDSGAMETCQGLLDRMGLMPYLRRIIRDEVDVVHSKERLQALAGDKAVKYEMRKEGGGLTCAIFVGDRLVARVEDRATVDEVCIKAAVEAVVRLSS